MVKSSSPSSKIGQFFFSGLPLLLMGDSTFIGIYQLLLIILLQTLTFNLSIQLNIANLIILIQNMENTSKNLRGLITQFIGFKDYSKEGIVKLKYIQNCIVSFSKTNDCFNVCLDILQKETVSEVQYFASMLLKDKLKYDFDQQESSEIERRYGRICQIIRNYSSATGIVITNLSFCLVYVFMHYSEIMGNPLQYLESSLKKANPNYFWKSLQLLPEEVDNSRVVIDQQVRLLCRRSLENYQKNVLIELGNRAEVWLDDQIKKDTILTVFANWISVGYQQQLMDNLIHHPILPKAVEYLSHSHLSDAACQCLAQILNSIRNPQEHLQLFTYLSNVIDILTEKVLGLIKEGEIQIAQNYVGILCDFGIKASTMLIDQSNKNTLKFLQFMLQFTIKEEINCFSILGDFWVCFLNELKNKSLQEGFYNLVKELLFKVCSKIRISYSLQLELNEVSEQKLCKLHKEADDLRDKRQQAKQIFRQICVILKKQAVLHQVFISLQKVSQTDNKVFWQTLQAYLYLLSNVVKYYPSRSQEIQLIVKTYEDLQPTLIAVKRSYLKFFKSLTTAQHSNPQLMLRIFTYIGSMLHQPLLTNQAEKVFQKACQTNPHMLCANIGDFMSLLQTHSTRPNILKGVFQIMNSDEGIMKQYLGGILRFYCEKIKKATIVKEQMRELMNSLITIVKTISKPQSKAYEQSVKSLFVELWPMLKQSFLYPCHLQKDEDPHVQRCSKLIKVIMRSIKCLFSTFLKELFETVMEAYKKYPICSYLYLLEVSITVYYQYPDFMDYFRDIYCQFCNITFTHLTSEDKIDEYQYLVDDFMGMNKRFLIYNAEIVLKTDKIHSLLDLLLVCLGSKLEKLAKESYQLLQVLYAFNWTQKMIMDFNREEDHQLINITASAQKLYQPLKQVLLSRTHIFIVKIIDHMSRCPYQSTANSIMDTLISEIKAFPLQNNKIWVNIMPAIPQDILTRKQKQRFLILLPQFAKVQTGSAEVSIIKIISTMNKRFRNRRRRQKLQ